MQKPKIYSYLALHDGAIEKMLHHGTTATNTELKAEQGFDERFTQRALYGSSVYLKVYQDWLARPSKSTKTPKPMNSTPDPCLSKVLMSYKLQTQS